MNAALHKDRNHCTKCIKCVNDHRSKHGDTCSHTQAIGYYVCKKNLFEELNPSLFNAELSLFTLNLPYLSGNFFFCRVVAVC